MTLSFNKFRITGTSFLAYLILAAIISPLGIVSQPIADRYSVSLSAATAVFSSLTTGILVGALIAIFIFDFLRIKTVVILTTLMTAASLAAIYGFDSFTALPVLLFIVGAGCGVALSTAAVVITNSYNERLRASMLLLTDSSYSGGAALSSFLAVALVASNWHWWSSYLLALGALSVMLLLASFSNFPDSPPSNNSDTDSPNTQDSWPLSVYICGLTLLFYLLGFVTIYSWVANYAQLTLGMEQAGAGNLVAKLFSGMFISQLCMFGLVLVLPVRLLVLACLSLATLVTASIWSGFNIATIETTIFALGLIGGGIFKVAVSYGTTLTEKPSPKMVSYFLFNTALGTAIAPALSAWIVDMSDTEGVMMFATVCYITSTILLITTYALARLSARQTPESELLS